MAGVAVLAVIPARSGSKGIPGKNLVTVGGRSLLAWAIEAALQSSEVDRIVVSTDDAVIARAAADLGATVPSLRPADLASDDTPMWDVLNHVLMEEVDPPTEAVVLLQPTSPLRPPGLIDECVRAKRRADADSVVTVTRVPHQFLPESLMVSKDGWMVPLEPQAASTRRQDKRELFARNGPAVLVTDPQVLRSGSLYGERTLGVEMSKLESIDIDAPEDVVIAESLLRR